MQKPTADVVLIALTPPAKVGLYIDKNLYKSYILHEQISESLSPLFEELFAEYEIKNILYAKGPGSFMAIKISYIFLKTLSIAKNIDIYAVEGFEFNKNSPIKANGNNYFHKRDGKIEIGFLDDSRLREFELPESFEITKYSKEIEPLYVLPPI